MLSSWRLYVYHLISLILPESSCFALKRGILRWCNAKIGNDVRICSSAIFWGAGNLEIGDNTWIGHGAMIIASGEMHIGKNVDIGPLVYLGNGTHKLEPQSERCAGAGVVRKITIGDGCWLGARATILPGVELDSMTTVAAGAVVTRSHDGHCLLTGVPAIEKKKW